ncbi:MAG TPA: heliorhodopsin HeR [Candidatus Bathyarchaeia archaeon]|nr:heliorhodopsin HeR [Candidatus Bathyarchaeia archaeon]
MEGIREKKTKEITYPGLRRFNGIMGAVHFIQASFMLIGGFLIGDIIDFRLPVTTDFLKLTDIGGGEFALLPETRTLFEIPLGPVTSSFLFLSAIAHFLIVLPKVNDFYNRNLEKGINYFRWFEYALSSSIMIVLIAMNFGVLNLAALISVVALNAAMNLMGLMMEIHNQDSEKTKWIAFYIGIFLGIIPWILIAIYIAGIGGDVSNAPWFVWAILGGYFFFFNTFPINMFLQYKRVGKWANYLYGERWYIILSLVSKSLLAWLVFAGTLRPV